MNALLGRLRHGNTHIFDFQAFILLLDLNKELKLPFSPHQVYNI